MLLSFDSRDLVTSFQLSSDGLVNQLRSSAPEDLRLLLGGLGCWGWTQRSLQATAPRSLSAPPHLIRNSRAGPSLSIEGCQTRAGPPSIPGAESFGAGLPRRAVASPPAHANYCSSLSLEAVIQPGPRVG